MKETSVRKCYQFAHKNDIIKGNDVLDTMVENDEDLEIDNDFENWDHRQILKWILSLENGLFLQYEDMLFQYLTQRNMMGSDLMDIQMDDVNDFGINDYKHVRKLYLNIRTLTNVEGNRDSD